LAGAADANGTATLVVPKNSPTKATKTTVADITLTLVFII